MRRGVDRSAVVAALLCALAVAGCGAAAQATTQPTLTTPESYAIPVQGVAEGLQLGGAETNYPAAVWAGTKTFDGSESLFVKTFNSFTGRWMATHQLTADASLGVGFSVAASGPDAVAVWIGANGGVYGAVRRFRTWHWSKPLQVPGTAGVPQVTLALDPGGNATVAFTREAAGGTWLVETSELLFGSHDWSKPMTVGTEPHAAYVFVNVSDENYRPTVVTWMASHTGAARNVVRASFRPGISTQPARPGAWLAPVTLGTATPAQDASPTPPPQLVTTNNHQYLIAWQYGGAHDRTKVVWGRNTYWRRRATLPAGATISQTDGDENVDAVWTNSSIELSQLRIGDGGWSGAEAVPASGNASQFTISGLTVAWLDQHNRVEVSTQAILLGPWHHTSTPAASGVGLLSALSLPPQGVLVAWRHLSTRPGLSSSSRIGALFVPDPDTP